MWYSLRKQNNFTLKRRCANRQKLLREPNFVDSEKVNRPKLGQHCEKAWYNWYIDMPGMFPIYISILQIGDIRPNKGQRDLNGPFWWPNGRETQHLIWWHILYSWIDHRLEVGPTLAFLLSLSGFKSNTGFGFLVKNYTQQVGFFERLKNELVWPKSVFLTILLPESIFGRKYRVLAITSNTSLQLRSLCLRVQRMSSEIVCAN